jgi:exonuclease VII large subunit
MDVAEFRAQQQALVQQEQQKRRALHQQLQQAAQQLQQAQQQLEEMQQLRDEVAALKQQHEAEQQQLSERLMESVNQKQVRGVMLQGVTVHAGCETNPKPKTSGLKLLLSVLLVTSCEVWCWDSNLKECCASIFCHARAKPTTPERVLRVPCCWSSAVMDTRSGLAN